MNVKVGQPITRQMQGFELSKLQKQRGQKQKYWNYPGIVTKVEANIITCRLDPPDNILIEFDAITGTCINGWDYG